MGQDSYVPTTLNKILNYLKLHNAINTKCTSNFSTNKGRIGYLDNIKHLYLVKIYINHKKMVECVTPNSK